MQTARHVSADLAALLCGGRDAPRGRARPRRRCTAPRTICAGRRRPCVRKSASIQHMSAKSAAGRAPVLFRVERRVLELVAPPVPVDVARGEAMRHQHLRVTRVSTASAATSAAWRRRARAPASAARTPAAPPASPRLLSALRRRRRPTQSAAARRRPMRRRTRCRAGRAPPCGRRRGCCPARARGASLRAGPKGSDDGAEQGGAARAWCHVAVAWKPSATSAANASAGSGPTGVAAASGASA